MRYTAATKTGEKPTENRFNVQETFLKNAAYGV